MCVKRSDWRWQAKKHWVVYREMRAFARSCKMCYSSIGRVGTPQLWVLAGSI